MRYRCGWCYAKGIKTEWQDNRKLPDSLPAGSISDGICPKCAKLMDKELDNIKTQSKKDKE